MQGIYHAFVYAIMWNVNAMASIFLRFALAHRATSYRLTS